MPKVGSKHFPYTKSGYEAAENEAKKTGKKLETPPAKKRAVNVMSRFQTK